MRRVVNRWVITISAVAYGLFAPWLIWLLGKSTIGYGLIILPLVVLFVFGVAEWPRKRLRDPLNGWLEYMLILGGAIGGALLYYVLSGKFMLIFLFSWLVFGLLFVLRRLFYQPLGKTSHSYSSDANVRNNKKYFTE